MGSVYYKVGTSAGRALGISIAWLRRQGKLGLGLAALAVILALGGGLAAAFHADLWRYYRVMAASNKVAPLSDEVRGAARDKAGQLAAVLEARLDKKRSLAGEAWPSAQILIALRENDPGSLRRVNSRVVEQHFRSVAGPECACWRRQPKGQFPNHLGVTSWVLWTLAAYGIPAQKGEMEFLLSTQDRDGGWPMFVGARQKRFASSYATAAAVLALHEQSKFEADPRRKERITAAVNRGANWLKTRVTAGTARWADYPSWPGSRKEFLGVSGFALFVLHHVGASGLAELDRDWLRRLPMGEPVALLGEVSGKSVQIGERSYRDDTRHYALPWGILATLLAYPSASISGRVRAIEWLELNLAPGAPVYALTGKERNAAIAAEALLALRSNPQAKRE